MSILSLVLLLISTYTLHFNATLHVLQLQSNFFVTLPFATGYCRPFQRSTLSNPTHNHFNTVAQKIETPIVLSRLPIWGDVQRKGRNKLSNCCANLESLFNPQLKYPANIIAATELSGRCLRAHDDGQGSQSTNLVAAKKLWCLQEKEPDGEREFAREGEVPSKREGEWRRLLVAHRRTPAIAVAPAAVAESGERERERVGEREGEEERRRLGNHNL